MGKKGMNRKNGETERGKKGEWSRRGKEGRRGKGRVGGEKEGKNCFQKSVIWGPAVRRVPVAPRWQKTGLS